MPGPPLPAATRRLFSAYDAARLDPAAAGRGGRSLLIGRLLEDGDGGDLRWLARTVPEAELAEWLVRHGGRQLSLRSLAFWQRVLDRPPGGDVEAGLGEAPGVAAGAARAARRQVWPL